MAGQYVARLNVRASGVDRPVARLSGGNQQKVLIAKWLITGPRILVVDEPTKGIDVGAKYEIHALLRDLAGGGAGIVVISSDMPEILGLCDRIVVMHEGRISGELTAEAATEDAIVHCAVGFGAQTDQSRIAP
jgi:ribose transport system ATP-binding protein